MSPCLLHARQIAGQFSHAASQALAACLALGLLLAQQHVCDPCCSSNKKRSARLPLQGKVPETFAGKGVAAPAGVDFLGTTGNIGPTAVEDFAAWHARAKPLPGSVYRHPIPIRPPQAGEQYAFEVDLDACSGCKACVTACHALNGLDPGEAWRNVTLLVGQDDNEPLLQHVTSSCHHCVSPACLQGCPANAYVKDEATGIVRHLDDACIGCRYCTFTCPYGAPQYVSRLGIVRKCDLCVGRLVAGEAPACVQGCPNDAIRVRVIPLSEVQARANQGTFLPHVAPPHHTQPASVYRGARRLGKLRLAESETWKPEEAHWPLAVMLVFTQLAFGAFAIGELVQHASLSLALEESIRAAVSSGAAILALGVSVLHLGRPLLAWRAVLGIRHSWLSREAVAFGLFAGLAAAATAAAWEWLPMPRKPWREALNMSVLAAGALGVLASVVVYHRTQRPSWQWFWVAPRFFLTAVSLGCATTLLYVVAASPDASATTIARACGAGVAASTLLKLAVEGIQIVVGYRNSRSPLSRSARLLTDVLYPYTVIRVALGWFGGVVIPLLVFVPLTPGERPSVVAALFLWALLAAAEVTERCLFFRAGVPAAYGRQAA